MFSIIRSFAKYNESNNLTYNLVMPGKEVEDFKVETLNSKLYVSCGSIEDSYGLPEFINKKKIKAKYKAGILTVTLPSKKEDKVTEIKVEES